MVYFKTNILKDLEEEGLSLKTLEKEGLISSSVALKIRKNKADSMTMSTISKLCILLNRNIEDLICYKEDFAEKFYKKDVEAIKEKENQKNKL